MARTPRVAIIGGGIGGLAACLAMRHRGIEAMVYEQSPRLSDIGAGLNLSPNALKAFRTLGMERKAVEVGYQPEFQVVRSWRSGRIIVRNRRSGAGTERYGAEFITIHRADLLDILAAGLPEDAVRLGASCTGVTTTEDVAAARFADGSEIEADVIVGADGIHSVVRESLFGADAPHFTGCVCWRGLVPREAVAREVMGVDDLSAWWGPHGHVVHYPVRRGELINFVAHIDSDAWTEESWTHECEQSELMETYARWNDSLLRLFESSERYYKWALFDRDPLDAWGRGRITLLGDSAHPMLPYLGQGACMAVEDGCILAGLLTRMPDDLSEALRTYERVRMPRTRRAQLGSRYRARENHLASPLARFRRDLVIALRNRLGVDRTPNQGAWIYEYDVATETGAAA